MELDKSIRLNEKIDFHLEKLRRTIKACNDIDLLREISLELLKLHHSKSVIADWATKRAAEAESRALVAEERGGKNL